MDNVTIKSTSCTKNYSIHHDDVTNSISFRITFGLVLVLVLLFTVIGGVFICYVVYKYKLAKKKFWLYLLILTASNMGCCIFEVPIMVAACIDQSVLEIRSVCILSGAILTIFSLLSIYTLAALSVYRHYTISKPLVSLVNTGKTDVVLFMVISISIAMFLCVSPTLGFSAYTYMPGRKWCIFKSPNKQIDLIYLVVIVTAGYILPVCVIIVSSLRVVVLVTKQGKIRMSITSQNNIQQEHNALLKTTALVIGAFFILFTPTLIYFVAGMSGAKVPLWFSHVVYLVLFCQGIVNASIYCFRHSVFKKELDIMICRNTYDRRDTATGSDLPVMRDSSV